MLPKICNRVWVITAYGQNIRMMIDWILLTLGDIHTSGSKVQVEVHKIVKRFFVQDINLIDIANCKFCLI